MNVTRLIVVAAIFLCIAAPAAASPAELKQTCVDASTEGQTQRDEGHLIEARAQLLICAQDACPSVVRKSCLEWLADVEARTPSVVVRAVDSTGSDVTDATLTVDGEEHALDGRPILLDPGTHTITVVQGSGEKSEQKVLLTEREKGRQITVQLGEPGAGASLSTRDEGAFSSPGDSEAPVSEQDREYSIPAGVWVLGAVGVVGIGAFAYLQVASAKELDDLKEECPFGQCTDEQTEPGRRKAQLSYIPLGIGAAALVGATTWAIVSWRKSKRESTSVALVPLEQGGFVSLSGRF